MTVLVKTKLCIGFIEGCSFSSISIFSCVCVCVCVCFETGYVAQADLALVILLCQSPECWDYRPTPPHPALHFYFLIKVTWLQTRLSLLNQDNYISYLTKLSLASHPSMPLLMRLSWSFQTLRVF
jgi:hypothetical protein